MATCPATVASLDRTAQQPCCSTVSHHRCWQLGPRLKPRGQRLQQDCQQARVVPSLHQATHCTARASSQHCTSPQEGPGTSGAAELSRRTLLGGVAVLGVSLTSLIEAAPAQAVQGLTAGRLPGLTTKPNSEGYLTYTRPEGKSGGHGVGWSEIPRYQFEVPEGWQETPVSIADLGGTEIDLRFANKDQGYLEVVVAPILRFIDVGFNADVRIESIGTPTKLINGFAPELYGQPLNEDDVLLQETRKGDDGLVHYLWELKPHHLVAATAFKNRVFLIALSANGRQWRKAEESLRHIQQSFKIIT